MRVCRGQVADVPWEVTRDVHMYSATVAGVPIGMFISEEAARAEARRQAHRWAGIGPVDAARLGQAGRGQVG